MTVDAARIGPSTPGKPPVPRGPRTPKVSGMITRGFALAAAGLLRYPVSGRMSGARRLNIQGLHHVALISSDYEVSKRFYTEVLGLSVIAETFRAARDSWKLDLAVPGGGQIELFSFPGAPPRPSRPEAQGLRHLAFVVPDVDAAKTALEAQGVVVEPVRTDALTDRKFTFFQDPDGLPLELYEG